MGYPVNDIMAEKWYMKIMMVFFTIVGIAGGAMSIAGPVVGLTLNPNDLTAANFKQVESFGLDAALYFDCDKVDSAFGQNMVQQMMNRMSENSGVNATTMDTPETGDNDRTSTDDTFKRLCFDRKGSHLYIAVTSGAFTLVGMFVFIVCGAMKKFEPGFVYFVPMLLSFVMVYDFIETNSMMIGFIKKCTEPDITESDEIDKTKNLVLWAPGADGQMVRYGVTKFGQTCANGTVPFDSATHRDSPCRPDLANPRLLCTHYYTCQDPAHDKNVACSSINFRESLANIDPDHDREDKACNDLGEGLIVWILGAIFNIIACGMMMSALHIRKEKAIFAAGGCVDSDVKVMPTVVNPRP